MCRFTPLALAIARAKCAGSVAAPAADVEHTAFWAFVRETAQRVHGRYYALARQTAQDFIAQSPTQIWSRIESFAGWYHEELPAEVRADQSKDYFAAWCYRELNYRYLDAGRVQKAQPKLAAIDSVGDPEDKRPAATSVAENEFSLDGGDLEQLAGWDALDGVILFTLAGAWEMLPAEIRGRWQRELSLENSFPPVEFAKVPRAKKRAALADLLGVSRDVIYQRWLRLKRKHLA